MAKGAVAKRVPAAKRTATKQVDRTALVADVVADLAATLKTIKRLDMSTYDAESLNYIIESAMHLTYVGAWSSEVQIALVRFIVEHAPIEDVRSISRHVKEQREMARDYTEHGYHDDPMAEEQIRVILDEGSRRDATKEQSGQLAKFIAGELP